jgi:hypothetical protein
MEIKDVSQSTNLYEIAKVIQQLNPNAEIRFGNIEYDPEATTRFYSSVPMDQLLLPDGFYANKKNGITNKHKTQSGMYCALMVEDLRMADERRLMPKIEQIIKREKPNTPEAIQRVKEVVIKATTELKEKVLNKEVDNNAKHR